MSRDEKTRKLMKKWWIFIAWHQKFFGVSFFFVALVWILSKKKSWNFNAPSLTTLIPSSQCCRQVTISSKLIVFLITKLYIYKSKWQTKKVHLSFKFCSKSMKKILRTIFIKLIFLTVLTETILSKNLSIFNESKENLVDTESLLKVA